MLRVLSETVAAASANGGNNRGERIRDVDQWLRAAASRHKQTGAPNVDRTPPRLRTHVPASLLPPLRNPTELTRNAVTKRRAQPAKTNVRLQAVHQLRGSSCPKTRQLRGSSCPKTPPQTTRLQATTTRRPARLVAFLPARPLRRRAPPGADEGLHVCHTRMVCFFFVFRASIDI